MTALYASEVSAELPPEPYPGLRPFEHGEWAIFFGREPMIDTVIQRLLKRRIVLVHGASGCGKSSLIRAGVLPRLSIEYDLSDEVWRAAAMRPADRPLHNLAQALQQQIGPPPDVDASRALDAWQDLLATGTALNALRRCLATAKFRLCILIDQFEEVFRHARNGGRAEVMLLTGLLRQFEADPLPGLYILLTMRSEYIGLCSEFEGFEGTVDRCQYLLPRMNSLALLRAIHEPARLFGGSVAAEVGDRLLVTAQSDEDGLPILQHTLMRAANFARQRHRSGEGWTVTADDVVKAEGTGSALSSHADEILNQLTQADKQMPATVQWLFRSLSDVDAQGRIIRRPRRFGDLVQIAGGDAAMMRSAIDAFRASGCCFLLPSAIDKPEPLTNDTEIDVSHEALLRRWTKLSDRRRDAATDLPVGWLWREVEDGQRWRALAVQAQTFNSDHRATLTPATTTAYKTWWPEHNAAWAARYTSPGRSPQDEYNDIEALWKASVHAARNSQWAFLAIAALLAICLALLSFLVAPQIAEPILRRSLTGAVSGAVGAIATITMLKLAGAFPRDKEAQWTIADVPGLALGGVGGAVSSVAIAPVLAFSVDLWRRLIAWTGWTFTTAAVNQDIVLLELSFAAGIACAGLYVGYRIVQLERR